MRSWRNWSGRVTATPTYYERPATESELKTVVREALGRGDTIRVAGSGHSFSPVVPTDKTLISLEEYTGVTAVDTNNNQVTVRAGTKLSELNAELATHDLAMSNLGDIDQQTVAGALLTGTHGTGLDFGVLANQISSLRLLTADGEFVELHLDEDPERFRAAQVSIGTLGIVSELTLSVEPAYDLCLRRRALPFEYVLDSIEDYHETHRQWEFFWFPHTDQVLVKTFDEVPRGEDSQGKQREEAEFGPELEEFGAWVSNTLWDGICRVGSNYPRKAAYGSKLAARTLSDKSEVGPSYEVFANPRNVRFHETEYGVPAADLPAVLRDIRAHIETNDVPVQFPIECRFVGGDEPYLSPAHGRDSGFLAVHHYHRKDLSDFFEQCERIFSEYDGRPHWGKHHTKTADELKNLYPKWERFQEIRMELDPGGHFLNDHLEAVLGGSHACCE